jgi:hypothetical protein
MTVDKGVLRSKKTLRLASYWSTAPDVTLHSVIIGPEKFADCVFSKVTDELKPINSKPKNSSFIVS